MVALLIRLRWRLWSRLVRRNTGLLVSTILGVLVGVIVTRPAYGPLREENATWKRPCSASAYST